MTTHCQHYLAHLYKTVKKTVICDATLTYGEILYPSIETMLAYLNITNHDVFVDFGSGVGKIVAQVFLNTPVKEAIGIELLPALHAQAISARESIRQDLPDFFAGNRQLSFLHGSFFDIAIPQATIALLCSQCFSQKMLLQLGQIINETPSIRTVLTLRPIDNLIKLTLKKVFRVECSWDTALCYLYESHEI